ncbi:unnamed protein product [Lathyrus oleraceus]
MKTLIIVMIFAITLILSLEVNVVKARTYPSSSQVSKVLSSFQPHKEGSSKSTQDQHEVVASLKFIPPSRPNPTQNKLNPKIKD